MQSDRAYGQNSGLHGAVAVACRENGLVSFALGLSICNRRQAWRCEPKGLFRDMYQSCPAMVNGCPLSPTDLVGMSERGWGSYLKGQPCSFSVGLPLDRVLVAYTRFIAHAPLHIAEPAAIAKLWAACCNRSEALSSLLVPALCTYHSHRRLLVRMESQILSFPNIPDGPSWALTPLSTLPAPQAPILLSSWQVSPPTDVMAWSPILLTSCRGLPSF